MPGRWVVVVPVKDAAEGKTRLSGALDERSRTALARAMALDTIAAAAACEAVGVVVVVTADEVVAGEAAGARTRPDRTAAAVTGRRELADSAAGRVNPEPSHAGARTGLDAGAAVRVIPEPSHAGGRSGRDGGAAVRVIPEPSHTAARSGRDAGAAVSVIPEPAHTGARSGLDAAAAAGVAHARTVAPAAPVAVLLGDLPALRPDDLGSALVAAETHPRAMVADAPGTGTTLLALSTATEFESRFGSGSAAAHVALGYVPLDIAGTSTLRRDIDLPADLDTLLTLRPGARTARLLDRLLPDGGPARSPA